MRRRIGVAIVAVGGGGMGVGAASGRRDRCGCSLEVTFVTESLLRAMGEAWGGCTHGSLGSVKVS